MDFTLPSNTYYQTDKGKMSHFTPYPNKIRYQGNDKNALTDTGERDRGI